MGFAKSRSSRDLAKPIIPSVRKMMGFAILLRVRDVQ